ncbi:hypothetical protein KZ483_23275 [Paenibacillus sp. sptzw28]|uniref:hypothetical protein n=1 Tax=Paenibacillus sp. sptzw28 TaxID=715179 RepID=UPI001C6EC678|nr:hypothetical protein [Paenibacillus sp. sptzw28]QYR20677.1 hypothetical protein KZ483_23275 [Paenibacillus sp. sptzw28]
MNKRNLILAVKEAEYIARLAEYIRHSPFGDDWQLTAFTNPAALRHYLRAGYGADLIAAQPVILGEIGDAGSGIPTAVLVTRSGQYTEHPEVHQFQPLPQLLQAFSAVYAASGEYSGEKPGERTAAPVIAVYSAAGGIGKTTLSIQLAQQAGVRGARVFYLNLEQWNATALWFGDDGPDDFAHMLYTLQAQPDKATARLSELRKRHPTLKIDFFAPGGNADEQLTISPGQVQLLLGIIAGSGQYDLVVVDLDSRLEPLQHAVMEASEHILWLVADDAVTRSKTGLALQYGERKWGPDFSRQKRKFLFVDARASRLDTDKVLEVQLAGSLPFVAEWANGRQSVDRSIPPAYRGAVDALLAGLSLHERGGDDARGDRASAQE